MITATECANPLWTLTATATRRRRAHQPVPIEQQCLYLGERAIERLDHGMSSFACRTFSISFAVSASRVSGVKGADAIAPNRLGSPGSGKPSSVMTAIAMPPRRPMAARLVCQAAATSAGDGTPKP